MPDTQLQSAVPATQQPAGATGIQQGNDGQMYFHDAAGKQLGLAPANIQQDNSEPAAPTAQSAPQKVKFNPNAPYESVTVAGQPVPQKQKFDPNASYESVTVGGQPVTSTAAPSTARRVFDAVQGASNAVQDADANVGIGFAKGVGKTVLGAAELGSKALDAPMTLLKFIPGVKQKLDKWMPEMGKVDDYIKAATGDANATLETHGVAQNIGGIAESIAEFMVGEGELKAGVKAATWADHAAEVSKAGKLLEKYPRLGRVITNAMRASALGGAQHLIKTGGEDPVGSLETGSVFGASTGAIEGSAEFLAKPAAKWLFKYLSAPDTLKTAQEALEASKAGSEHSLQVAKRALYPGAEKLTGTELSEQIQKDLKVVRREMYNDYEDSRAAVTNKVKDVDQQAATTGGTGIQVGGKGSPLQLKAAEFGGETNAPQPLTSEQAAGQTAQSARVGVSPTVKNALHGVNPDMEKIQPLLDAYADHNAPSMTWDEAEANRQAIGKAIDGTPYGDPKRRVLSQLKKSIDQSMEAAASAAGHPEIAEDMAGLREKYHGTVSKLEDNAVIRSLQNKDYDSVADVLMNRESVKNITDLRSLLMGDSEVATSTESTGNPVSTKTMETSKTMDAVESSIFQRLLDKSTVTAADGTTSISARSLTQKYNQIPPDVREAIWGDRAARVAKVVSDYQDVISKGTATEAAAKEMNDKAARIIGGFGIHGVPAIAAGHAIWRALNGDVSGAAKDIAAIAAWEGGLAALKNPSLQRGIMTLLEGLSQVSTLGNSEGDAAITERVATPTAPEQTPPASGADMASKGGGIGGKGGGINTQGAVASQAKLTPDEMAFELERQISSETSRLRTTNASEQEKAQLTQQIESWQQQLDEIRRPKTVGDLLEPTHRLDENGKIRPLNEQELQRKQDFKDSRAKRKADNLRNTLATASEDIRKITN